MVVLGDVNRLFAHQCERAAQTLLCQERGERNERSQTCEQQEQGGAGVAMWLKVTCLCACVCVCVCVYVSERERHTDTLSVCHNRLGQRECVFVCVCILLCVCVCHYNRLGQRECVFVCVCILLCVCVCVCVWWGSETKMFTRLKRQQFHHLPTLCPSMSWLNQSNGISLHE